MCSVPVQFEKMDWNFGGGVNDFLVPKDHDILYRHQPPESWSQWGSTDYEYMESLSKYIKPEETPTLEVDSQSSTLLTENTNSSRCGLSSKDSLHQNFQSQPGCMLETGAGADQMDDIFLSSLLDGDLAAMEDLNEPFGLSPEVQNISMPSDDQLVNMVSHSQRVLSHSNAVNPVNSNFLKADDFSQSWSGKMEESTSHSVSSTLQEAMLKIPVVATESGVMLSEDTSVEESVLHEFEALMAQMTQKTRICFRDSLYRLAKNSERQHMLTQSNGKDFAMESGETFDGLTRSETKKNTESKTNAIDRAIANLMFDKMESNARKPSLAALMRTARHGDDAEVPVVGISGRQRLPN